MEDIDFKDDIGPGAEMPEDVKSALEEGEE